VRIWPIYKKELRLYFTSPVAWVILTIFLAIAGFFFYAIFGNFTRVSMQMARRGELGPSAFLAPYLHRPRVLEAVDGVRLLLEAAGDLLVRGDLGVEDLDRVAPADLVLTDVDRRHPAEAEKALQGPLPPKRRPDSPFEELGLVPAKVTA